MTTKLKYSTKKVFWYSDLEKLVKQVYNEDIRLLDLLFEPSQNSYYEYTINGNSELTTVGDDAIVQKWIDNPGQTVFDVSDVTEIDWTNTVQLDVNHILYRLYIDDIIPSGEYVMTVWW